MQPLSSDSDGDTDIINLKEKQSVFFSNVRYAAIFIASVRLHLFTVVDHFYCLSNFFYLYILNILLSVIVVKVSFSSSSSSYYEIMSMIEMQKENENATSEF